MPYGSHWALRLDRAGSFYNIERKYQDVPQKRMTQYDFRTIAIFTDGCENPLFPTEVRDAAFRRHTGTAKKYNIVTLCNPVFQFLQFFIHEKVPLSVLCLCSHYTLFPMHLQWKRKKGSVLGASS